MICPPKTACEVMESRICLAGGGSLLPGMADLISKKTGYDVLLCNNPMHAVINGASQILSIGDVANLWQN